MRRKKRFPFTISEQQILMCWISYAPIAPPILLPFEMKTNPKLKKSLGNKREEPILISICVHRYIEMIAVHHYLHGSIALRATAWLCCRRRRWVNNVKQIAATEMELFS